MKAVFNYMELFNGDEPNVKNFDCSGESDYDFHVYEAVIIQQMNKEMFRDLNRKIRVNSKDFRCGHDYDCCGCLSRIHLYFEHVKNDVFKIRYTESFNY